jgi:uncharacterized protein (TIGR03643 family)
LKTSIELSAGDISRVIEMAWEDRTPFEAIERSMGLTQPQVIALMRRELKRSSFELWRKRTTQRGTLKHEGLRSSDVTRHHAAGQGKPNNGQGK